MCSKQGLKIKFLKKGDGYMFLKLKRCVTLVAFVLVISLFVVFTADKKPAVNTTGFLSYGYASNKTVKWNPESYKNELLQGMSKQKSFDEVVAYLCNQYTSILLDTVNNSKNVSVNIEKVNIISSLIEKKVKQAITDVRTLDKLKDYFDTVSNLCSTIDTVLSNTLDAKVKDKNVVNKVKSRYLLMVSRMWIGLYNQYADLNTINPIWDAEDTKTIQSYMLTTIRKFKSYCQPLYNITKNDRYKKALTDAQEIDKLCVSQKNIYSVIGKLTDLFTGVINNIGIGE